jgi:hypothetical protein
MTYSKQTPWIRLCLKQDKLSDLLLLSGLSDRLPQLHLLFLSAQLDRQQLNPHQSGR